MKYEEVIAEWNAQADGANDWTALGEDEKIEFAIALEREDCAKVCDEMFAGKVGAVHVSATRCANAIRMRSNA